MKKINFTTKDGKINRGIVTTSTMPNTSKKRVRHKKDNPLPKTFYKIKINFIPILGCIACVFGDWDINTDWTILRMLLFIINLFLIFEIERVEK